MYFSISFADSTPLSECCPLASRRLCSSDQETVRIPEPPGYFITALQSPPDGRNPQKPFPLVPPSFAPISKHDETNPKTNNPVHFIIPMQTGYFLL